MLKEFILILIVLFGIGLVFLGLYLARIALNLIFAPRDHREFARGHSPKSVYEIANGNADAYKNGERDYSVVAGMSVNLKTGKLEPQGRVSRELIEPLL